MERGACCFWLVLLLPACLNVPKLDPPPFVIDDFEDGDLVPRATAFAPWACQTVSSDSVDGGAPAEADAAPAPPVDGGSTASCMRELSGGDNSCCALVASFNLPASTAGRHDDARVLTKTAPSPVDFTRFQTFVFSSILESPPGGLPSGTQLFVELGCSQLPPAGSRSAIQNVTFAVNSPWTASRLPMSMFTLDGAKMNEACLLAVDSIRFVVRPALGAQPALGALHIDNVYLLQ
jgi:hypothetical protein